MSYSSAAIDRHGPALTVLHSPSAADRAIHRLMHEFYGLTEEEIRIVEEATAK